MVLQSTTLVTLFKAYTTVHPKKLARRNLHCTIVVSCGGSDPMYCSISTCLGRSTTTMKMTVMAKATSTPSPTSHTTISNNFCGLNFFRFYSTTPF